MDSYRKVLNQRQTELRRVMLSFNQHDKAIELFLSQHAMLHSANIAQMGSWSYEDEILDDLSVEEFRLIPGNSVYSVAWCIWHIALLGMDI